MDLSWKLAEAYNIFSDVALFVELGKYDLADTDKGTVFRNYHVHKKYGLDGTFQYRIYQNMMRSFQHEGIYTQEFQSVFEFPRSIHNLMEYIVKEDHKGIQFKGSDYDTQFKNVLMRIPGIGAKQATKGVKDFGSLYQLSLFAEIHLQETWGTKLGSKVYNFVRNQENKIYGFSK